MSFYYVPNSVLGTGNAMMNKQTKILVFRAYLYSTMNRENKQHHKIFFKVLYKVISTEVIKTSQRNVKHWVLAFTLYVGWLGKIAQRSDC